jgi:hypothetical protein
MIRCNDSSQDVSYNVSLVSNCIWYPIVALLQDLNEHEDYCYSRVTKQTAKRFLGKWLRATIYDLSLLLKESVAINKLFIYSGTSQVISSQLTIPYAGASRFFADQAYRTPVICLEERFTVILVVR